MTQEDKELLLKDLCARLPYRVKVQTPVMNDEITLTCGDISAYFFNPDNTVYPMPYLRPKSRIAELITAKEWSSLGGIDLIDWYNANHIDYRDLISLGLALEAPEDMYK